MCLYHSLGLSQVFTSCARIRRLPFPPVAGAQVPAWAAAEGRLSAEAQDLLVQLLDPDPARRLSATQATKHAWMSGPVKALTSVAPSSATHASLRIWKAGESVFPTALLKNTVYHAR